MSLNANHKVEIPHYKEFLSEGIWNYLLERSVEVEGIEGLRRIHSMDSGESAVETQEALVFLTTLLRRVSTELNAILEQRKQDRRFIDQTTLQLMEINQQLQTDYHAWDYQTILGQKDKQGRIVVGPFGDGYVEGKGDSIAKLPSYLQGQHPTLFGPPDTEKMSINAMNSLYRVLPNEPSIVKELVESSTIVPKWGADDEDSKTPMHQDLISAAKNLFGCFEGTLSYWEEETGKKYELTEGTRAFPIKRFPGLALPSTSLFLDSTPIPLHLYDFAIHLFHMWNQPDSLVFYVPKLENEEEAHYLHHLLSQAEILVQEIHPSYKKGTLRVILVLENPRAVFRVNEMMDALFPYFAGASLGWHDYLASTARLLKHDPNYRIPVKADTDIVIKHIKASHELLAEVVGSRGGIKIGGMYGILPTTREMETPSFQVTLIGFVRDVVTQMKRDLDGFWVAHPDFVRISIALLEAWNRKEKNPSDASLEKLVKSLVLDPAEQNKLMEFIEGEDIPSLAKTSPLYPRALLAAELKESDVIPNNHPDEVRYNVFQSLQYLTDWLTGNGCVALPAKIQGVDVRIMDDLATSERSRWELWHELHYGRFSKEDFLTILQEELRFIEKGNPEDNREIQVQWNVTTRKWYPIAAELLCMLVFSEEPPEFITELLMPFTDPSIRKLEHPLAKLKELAPEKYVLAEDIEKFRFYHELCGCKRFAKTLSKQIWEDASEIEKLILTFSKEEIIEASFFHGTIGASAPSLDKQESKEQAEVQKSKEELRVQLLEKGQEYQKKYGIKFLISAQGQTSEELLKALEKRMNSTLLVELQEARQALVTITQKRFHEKKKSELGFFRDLLSSFGVAGLSFSVLKNYEVVQGIHLGIANQSEKKPVSECCRFEVASLSKTVASAFALEYFRKKNISLDTSVNALLREAGSSWVLESKEGFPSEWSEEVTLHQLMNHSALGMHYVFGIPLSQPMPSMETLLTQGPLYDYEELKVSKKPGSQFHYSGGGFLVLQHLIETMEQQSLDLICHDFFVHTGLNDFQFGQKDDLGSFYACGYDDQGKMVEGTRKMFPAFAAGGLGTSSSFAHFLSHLCLAFRDLEGSGGISHDTAVQMLYGEDLGSVDFMGAKMGIGVFVAEAGDNKVALHQAANDGFRGLYILCFDGPNRGDGFVMLSNGDNQAMLLNAFASQEIMRKLRWEGVNTSLFSSQFDLSSIPQEEIVNLGYKKLLFSAFEKTLPEVYEGHIQKEILADWNLCCDAKVVSVSNDRFARASNLLSPFQPLFDGKAFGKNGKIMDSWESVRHNTRGFDLLELELSQPSSFSFAFVSTEYHNGNHAEYVEVDSYCEQGKLWKTVLPKQKLEGHSHHFSRLFRDHGIYQKVQVKMYPDGGLTRLGLYSSDLPLDLQAIFPKEEGGWKVAKCFHPIPSVSKPAFEDYLVAEEEIENNWQRLKEGQRFNVASSLYGAVVCDATDQHYGPAKSISSPFSPEGMFDGFETARSREKGHFDSVAVELKRPCVLENIEIDFRYFVNNNPRFLSIDGVDAEGNKENLLHSFFSKPYAGNQLGCEVKSVTPFCKIICTTFPDGGFNRLKLWSVHKK